jgi:hypothetical protein
VSSTGYRMAFEEHDQLKIWFLFKRAIVGRMPVKVSYFKRKTDNHEPVSDKYGNPVYAKITRIVEPYALDVTSNGKHIVRVVDRSPEGVNSRPEYRSIRLDRIAVRYSNGLPLVAPMPKHGFLCLSPLDGYELHPTKGELGRNRKHGILLAL